MKNLTLSLISSPSSSPSSKKDPSYVAGDIRNYVGVAAKNNSNSNSNSTSHSETLTVSFPKTRLTRHLPSTPQRTVSFAVLTERDSSAGEEDSTENNALEKRGRNMFQQGRRTPQARHIQHFLQAEKVIIKCLYGRPGNLAIYTVCVLCAL